MREKITNFFPLILLLFTAFILRIINIESFFYFTYDEAVPAFVGRRLILWNHLPLIGGVTPFGFHLAPYFYWLLSGILYLGRLNPVSWGYAAAAVSILTTIAIYILGKELYSKKVGFIAAFFWTFSYIANLYDRHFWALYWGPLISTLVILSLKKITEGQKKYYYILGLTLAFALSADPSNLVFFGLSALIFFIFKISLTKHAVAGILIIILSLLPLAAFDLRHNFANTKPLLKFWQQGKNKPGFENQKFVNNSKLFPQSFARVIYTFSNDNEISKQYSYCQNYVTEKLNAVPNLAIFLSTIIISFFIYSSLKQKNKVGEKIISLLILLYFFGIQIYGTLLRADIFEHYITGLFPVFIIIIAKYLSFLPKKVLLVVLIIFSVVNLAQLKSAKNSLGLKIKREAINFAVNEVGNNDFSIESLSSCWKLSGYRYLFAVFGREPVKSYVDPNLSYLYGTTKVSPTHPKTVVALVAHDFQQETPSFYEKYTLYKSHEIESSTFGSLEVIILDNSAYWFDQTTNLDIGQD